MRLLCGPSPRRNARPSDRPEFSEVVEELEAAVHVLPEKTSVEVGI
jgi:hypothetical protein